MEIESVALLGGGTMGARIAGYLARAGLRVALADASPELAEHDPLPLAFLRGAGNGAALMFALIVTLGSQAPTRPP